MRTRAENEHVRELEARVRVLEDERLDILRRVLDVLATVKEWLDNEDEAKAYEAISAAVVAGRRALLRAQNGGPR